MTFRMVRLITLFILVALCSTSHAAYQAFTRQSKQPGIWGLLSHEDRIEAFFFDEAKKSIVILDEGAGKPIYGTLENAMLQNGCIAGVNGGYFSADTQKTPLGLVRHRGKTHHSISRGAFTVAGILYDTGQTIKLERTSKLTTALNKIQEAIQGGPFLIEKGSITPGLDNVKSARRTFVATDGKGNWCIATTTSMTLKKLAIWLSKPGTLGKFQIQTALNLDGGTSSAIWVKSPHLYRAPFKEVRNYIGISPRPTYSPDSTTKNKRR